MYEGSEEDFYYGYNATSVGNSSRHNKSLKLHEYDSIGQEGPQNREYFALDESVEPPVDVRDEVTV
jgi:hypothetical protein